MIENVNLPFLRINLNFYFKNVLYKVHLSENFQRYCMKLIQLLHGCRRET